MAGIGFELKRLFEKKSISAKLTAIVYSVFTTIGHLVAVIVMLLVIRVLLNGSSLNTNIKQLYFTTVLYTFIFPLIFTSGFNLVLSRYIADSMWQNKNDDILASLYGVLPVYFLIASPPAIAFLYFSKQGLLYSVSAYLLYLLVGIIFLLMVYVSAVKDYKYISFSYIGGLAVTLITSYIAVYYSNRISNIVSALLLSFVLGMSIIALSLIVELKRFFVKSSNKYFNFLLYFKRFPDLIFLNLFYTLGLYTQNFVFWLYPQTKNQLYNFIFSETFDFACGLAILTILPATVIFVVRMETSFYTHYREYLRSINTQKGEVIEKAKEKMITVMWKELFYVFDIQIICTLLFVAAGIILMPKIGIQADILEVFPYVSCGFMFTYLTFVTNVLIMYFENYKDCKKVMFLFMCLNTVFTYITVLLGDQFYGLGIILASMVSLGLSLIYLKKTMDNVDYIIFCSQSLLQEERPTFINRLIPILNGEHKNNDNNQ